MVCLCLWAQSQAGWDLEHSGVEGGVPAYCRGLELDDVRGPLQPKPFYDSMLYRPSQARKLSCALWYSVLGHGVLWQQRFAARRHEDLHANTAVHQAQRCQLTAHH